MSHIKNLVYNFIWYSCPELVLNGHLYAAAPPLYRITKNKDKYLFLKDDAALEKYKLDNGKIGPVTRLKGLGEMNKDDTFETMLDPKTRVINQLNVKQDNADEIDSFFTLFMGKDTEARKTFVKENLRNAKIEV